MRGVAAAVVVPCMDVADLESLLRFVSSSGPSILSVTLTFTRCDQGYKLRCSLYSLHSSRLSLPSFQSYLPLKENIRWDNN